MAELKSDALMEQMKQHLATDAGKEVARKINLVYQMNIAPKVPQPDHFLCILYCAPNRNLIRTLVLISFVCRKLDSRR